MAYAESTVGGSLGGNYRVWVNSIRTYDGNPAENFEDWRAEGGLNKIGGGTAYNGYNSASYTLQLGLNGVASSGNFSYNFGAGTGTVLSWGTGTTRAYRNTDGTGYGFQSRMDINLANSPYLTSGWVVSNDGIQTKYRQANLTSAPNFTDEDNPTIGYSNPAGNSVNTLMVAIYNTGGNVALAGYRSVTKTGSSYTFNLTDDERNALRAFTPNSNTATVRFYLRTNVAGSDFYSTLDRTLTIVNANPVFTNFTYEDTNPATVAVTGDSQALVEGLSDLRVTVPSGSAATTQKFANRGNYSFTIGSYSSSSPWPASGNVVHDVGSVTGVTGVQGLSVRAIDSRGNGTAVSKNVTILPYSRPAFYIALYVRYANNFDATDGIEAGSFDTSSFGLVWPLTLGGVDKNVINPVSGLQFDISKGNSTSFTGTWTNVATVQTPGSGVVTVDFDDLGNDILSRMSALGVDNTIRWYIKFRMTDGFNTSEYTRYIDVGRPILRIGSDGKLYHNEVEFHVEFNPQKTFVVPGVTGYGGSGTWQYEAFGGYVFSTGAIRNTAATAAIGDYSRFDVFLNAGTFNVLTSFWGGPTAGEVECYIAGYEFGGGVFQYEIDNYATGNTEMLFSLNGLEIVNPGYYSFAYRVSGKNAASTSYRAAVLALKFTKTA